MSKKKLVPTENRVELFGTLCDETRVLNVLVSISRIRRDEFNL